MAEMNKLRAEKATKATRSETHALEVDSGPVVLGRRSAYRNLHKRKTNYVSTVRNMYCTNSIPHSARAQAQEIRAIETRHFSPPNGSLMVISTNKLVYTACATIFHDGFAG